MIVRKFKNEDSVELAEVIAKTLRTTNSKDYSSEYIENDISFLTADKLIERSNWTKIMETLEQDDYFFRAKRIEIPASITAVKFYKSLAMIIKMVLMKLMMNNYIDLKNLDKFYSVFYSFKTDNIK